MAAVGRRRLRDDGLEPRVYERRGTFYYVHRDGRWEGLGKDKATANRKARFFNDPDGNFGTVVYWLEAFLIHCAARVKAGTLAQRTLDDYTVAVKGNAKRPGALSVFFAPPMTPQDIEPAMVQDFITTNSDLGRPVPANREKAALSAAFSWLISAGKVPGLKLNPCLRASGVRRNRERKRDRYVTHAEYRAVWAVAPQSVRLMMDITYRTLQRPESDIINWTTEVLKLHEGRRVLAFRQFKTGKTMRVALTPELDAQIRESLGDVPKLRQPLIRRQDGKPYTYDGLSAMLKRAIKKAGVESFGFRDLKGKGATDMWRDGVPIEDIQMLCGHETKSTTEIYVKQRWNETAEPNTLAV